ncbi:FAD-dependent thymidylate synthase [Pyrococcus abyssi]|uniref:Flavin-dependent thymidylate synthase n=1 Tax=Pyrococcus abyssi (strain GE5 / Orsay) TaxID=272844 RepID=THYX_PYRAB|nr:FAD-dependent thymidylate synthase [Pyrococcus abyssi]Q9UZ51.1 RecName: Full=Flavin-dependent thymidylate synthase; Short=FDTS; AltName: Full=FAD-dependent thymidylate synthase; AltName: Full=Thymidylate synthase ThyX; Short=TS; Short=TSase [Pyrococcus abyssi GE5]CAB50208.1 thyX Flavin dependent thymidylate synthase [Pyrococcus abyssi GE5]CCE70744.1 TPA: FAD-dependent thymidylate synthase [Pyrococcus abyssi GE5]
MVRVTLVNYTRRPLETITWAALVSYWDEWSTESFEKINEDDVKAHLPRILGYGHESILEHATFTFSIEGCSRVCTHQLVRHRIASYTQQSQRYIVLNEENVEETFVIPESIKKDRELYEKWKKAMAETIKLYKESLKRGIHQEDARFILPQAVRSKIVVTMNLRELKHFFGLRLCERAQWEIREVAWKMLEEIAKREELRPIIKWAKLGPRCIQLGYCPERELMPPGCFKRTRERWMKLLEKPL